MDEYYPAANRYLSLMYESDQAFKHLVEHFSKVKELDDHCGCSEIISRM